jgi:CHASE3 domain sensor protein
MTDLMEAFKASLQQISNSEENTSKFKVVGSEGKIFEISAMLRWSLLLAMYVKLINVLLLVK